MPFGDACWHSHGMGSKMIIPAAFAILSILDATAFNEYFAPVAIGTVV